jgi:hypothetical protein
VPNVTVGDEAFGLTNFPLTPYAGNDLSEKKKVFNYGRSCRVTTLIYLYASMTYANIHGRATAIV